MRAYLAMMALAVPLLLAGCDNDSSSATVKVPPTPAPAPKTPVAAEPQSSVAELRGYRLDPLPAKALVLPAPPPKKQDLVKNSQIKQAVVLKTPTTVTRPLDLSVPTEVDTAQAPRSYAVASRGAENSVAEVGLLPQLFHKEDDPGRFELGGRVISRDRSDDFEGAEVELRFRR